MGRGLKSWTWPAAAHPQATAWLNKLKAPGGRGRQREGTAPGREAARAAAEAERRPAATSSACRPRKPPAAAESAKVAAKAETAPVNFRSGLGARTKSLRTNWRAEITDLYKAVWHYRDHPKMAALVQELANADARAQAREQNGKSTIPGVAFVSEQVAA